MRNTTEATVSAVHAPRQLDVGELLSPQELALVYADSVGRLPPYRGWAISAQIPASLMRLLESDLVPFDRHISLFQSTRGALYPMVVLQAAAMQVRVMLCLADPRVQQWLRDASANGKTGLVFQIEETGQSVVAECPCDLRPASEIEDLIRECVKLGRPERLEDLAGLVKRMSSPGGAPSLIAAFKVHTVRLVVIPESQDNDEAWHPAAVEQLVH